MHVQVLSSGIRVVEKKGDVVESLLDQISGRGYKQEGVVEEYGQGIEAVNVESWRIATYEEVRSKATWVEQLNERSRAV